MMKLVNSLSNLLTRRNAGVGLDVGRGAVKAVLLHSGKGGEIVAEVAVLDRQAEGFIDDQELHEHLRPWLAESTMGDCETVVGIPQDVTNIQVTDFPPNALDSLDSMVAFQTQQLGDLSEDTFVHDYVVLPPSESRPMPVLIGVCLESIIQARTERYTANGVRLADLGMNAVALADACFRLKPDSMRTPDPQLLLDIGAESTTMLVMANGQVLFATALMMGSTQFIEALAEKWDVPPADVRRSTRRYRIMQADKKDPVTQAGAQFLGEVQAALSQWQEQDAHGSELGDPVHAYVCGGGALLTGLPEFLGQKLSCDVTILSVPGLADESSGPLCVTAYGLALQAVGDGFLSLSLAPKCIRWRAKRRQRSPFLMAATVTWVLFLTLAFIVNRVQLDAQLMTLKQDFDRLSRCEEVVKTLDETIRQSSAVEQVQLPLVEYGNRSLRFAVALEKLGEAQADTDWYIYLGDSESFESRKIVEDETAAGKNKETERTTNVHPFLGPSIRASSTGNEQSAQTTAGKHVVTKLQPLTGMVAAGYTRLLEDQPYQPVRDIVRILNNTVFFENVDLLPAGELRGREDIFLAWQQFLFHTRKKQDLSFKPFTLRLPFAVTDITAGTDKDKGGASP
ncbi:MAG: pilus assembly protein PilM [Candidatus Pacebacteria bacterium]|nr:pilus assembly protein PilM [Candidatus Paceibacterota bacterium]